MSVQMVLLWMTFMTFASLTTYVLVPGTTEAVLRKRVRNLRIRSTDPETIEEQRLAQPFFRRVLVPLLQTLYVRLERITPTGVLHKLSTRLQAAGKPMTVGQFLLVKALLAAGLGICALLVEVLGGMGWSTAVFPVVVAAAGWVLPEVWLAQISGQRRKKLARALPDVLDMLSVSVEAGLGFDGAAQKVSEKFPDPVATEFAEYLKEVRLGKSREVAMRNLSERSGLSDMQSFVAAVIQADRLGVSLSRVLRIQSDQLRTRRMQQAEERAMQTPIKMVFPLVFFIFPTLFVILLGPAMLHILELFGAS